MMAHAARSSPLQNRVDPWSRVVATRERGQWMGNRGCLHDAQGRIVRAHQVTRWIICVLEFKGRERTIMQPGHYTELFFLDEATAFAAGHRPCAECQRTRYTLFLDFWQRTQGGTIRPRADEVDAVLHAARWAQGGKVVYRARLGDLPMGTMVTSLDDERPYLVGEGQLYPWTFAGYQAGLPLDSTTEMRVLTPRPLVDVLAAGYPVQMRLTLPPFHSTLEAGRTS